MQRVYAISGSEAARIIRSLGYSRDYFLTGCWADEEGKNTLDVFLVPSDDIPTLREIVQEYGGSFKEGYWRV